ncbi:MAG TPA: ABC transporter permease subunit [Thermoanaerobaculia bacterium]|nr:ABC transporter permease subunit [Thermoanaerobaculia bacterium]
MIGLTLLHRIKEDILGGKAVVVVLVTLILMCASTALTLGELQRRQRMYEAEVVRQHDIATITQDPDIGPMLRRPELLSVLVHGVDAGVYKGKSVSGVKVERAPPGAYDNPLLALFPTPDLGFVVQYILSLFALMMAFDVAAGPKERRTLSLIFSNPVSRVGFFLGQCLGSYVLLALAFLLGLLGSVAILVVSGAGTLSAGVLVRIAGIAFVALLYLAVFFMVGAMISASTASSSRAFIASLLTWAVLVLVLSQSMMLLAGHLRRVPSIEVVTAEMNAARNQILGKEGAFMTEWPKANAATEAVEARYAREVAAQERLMKVATRSSPAGSFVLATAALSGTSSDDAEAYLSEIRGYLSRLRQFVYVDARHDPKAERPVYFSHRPSLGETLAHAAPDAVLLILWLGAFGFVALRRFLHYDLR